MKTIMALGLIVSISIIVVMGTSTPQIPPGVCLDIMPICRPGTVPICICESDISLRCGWTCGSQR